MLHEPVGGLCGCSGLSLQVKRIVSSLRNGLGVGSSPLRSVPWSILQMALAASVAWYISASLFGSDLPFFASAAAIVTIGVTTGLHGRRAIQVVLGVSFGLVFASLLTLAIGSGAIQIGIVIALAVSVAMYLSKEPLFLNQTAISAMLVVALESSLAPSMAPSIYSFTLGRFLDALVGSSVAIIASLVLPINPRRDIEDIVQPILDESVNTLKESAAALSDADLDRAESAFREARQITERLDSFKESLLSDYETARYAPPRRQDLRHLELYATAATQIDLAVSDVRGVARAAARAVRQDSTALEPLSQAISDLAQAVDTLGTLLEEARPLEDVRPFLYEAAQKATAVLENHRDMATGALVGEIRATTVDLLMSTGLERDEVLRELEEFARYDQEQG
jgi:uncharacterized membrane protein YgaE (UPF0421/DUF939 family)